MIAEACHAMHVAHLMQRMHNGCMDDFTGLELIDPDDGSWPSVPPPVTPGHVDLTGRLSNGSVWRVATTSDEIGLTIAGPDGMVTLVLAEHDAAMLEHALGAGAADLHRTRNGLEW